MALAIILAPQAVQDLKRLRAARRATVKEAVDVHLRHDVTDATVEVLAVVVKTEAES